VPDAPLVIVNPVAGGGRAARIVGWLRERLRTRPDARLEVTKRPGDAERLASDAGSQGNDRVVAVGGDGTVQEVINGLINGSRGPVLGIVPVGSGNDLARSLRLPLDPAAGWTLAVGRHHHALDLARAHDEQGRMRWFASAGGVGFDAQVAAAMQHRSGWQRGRIGYLLTTISELRHFTNRRVRITMDGTTLERDVLFVAITNGEYYGGGMRISPGALTDDALLDVCIVGNISRLTAIQQLPHLYRGTHTRHPAVETTRVRSIVVEGDRDSLVHLDGEPFGHLPVRIEIHPGRLTMAGPAR
jgi:diacylglycerol kinase (ATP)